MRGPGDDPQEPTGEPQEPTGEPPGETGEQDQQELWPPQAVARHAGLCREAMAAKDDICLTCYTFNQDQSLFMCGTTSGFRIFRRSPVCEMVRQESTPRLANRSVVLAAMLHQTSIVAMLVGYGGESVQSEEFIAKEFQSSTQRGVVQIWDEAKHKFVGEVRSRYEVLNLVLRRDIIALVCEMSINVYSLERLRHQLTLTTQPNPKGLCVTATGRKEWLLCMPGGSQKGEVRLQFGESKTSQAFLAHETELAALAVNELGTRIATASEFGTVVKVFERAEGQDVQLLHRLRVGPPAKSEVISSIVFRPDDAFIAIAVASASMIHIFRTSTGSRAKAGSGSGPADVLASAPEERSSLSSLLTGAVKKGIQCLSDERTWARFSIPDDDLLLDARSRGSRISGPLVCFSQNDPQLTIVHHNGMLYEVSFDPVDSERGCILESGKAWFQGRAGFQIRGESQEEACKPGGADEADDDADDWAVV